MSARLNVDLCVIGAGSAGLSVAAGAAQLGRKVALVEKGKMGGDCLNYGCVPSKALIAAARAAAEMRAAARLGVTAEPHVDFPAVIDHVHRAIAAIAPHDSQERFEGLGVAVIRDAAAFIGPRAVVAGDREICAKHFVVATGSTPAIPPVPGLDTVDYFTNETIFENRELPDHLIVIGGGPIGCELGQAFARLGARASIVEATAILPREEPEAVDLLRESLRADGVALHEHAKAVRVRPAQSGVAVDIEGPDGAATLTGSHLLLAAGRKANVAGLDLERAGVDVANGAPILDERLRTSNKRIYVIGDAAGGAQFTHLAGDHASTLIKNVLFKMPSKRRDGLAPRATYTSPEVAAIGLSEEAARKEGRAVRVATWSFKDNDRAQAEARTEGFAKIVTDGKGRLVGATIIGENAGELIHPLAFAFANGLPVKSFTNYIAPYPTRGEIAKRVAGAWYAPALFSDKTRTLVRLLALFD